MSYPAILIYSAWVLTHIHRRIWWSEIKIIHFWKTITRQGGLISFRRQLEIKSQREAEKRSSQTEKASAEKNKHLSFHGSALSYIHVGWSDPRSLSRHPRAPAGPLPETTTSGTSSCAFLHGFVLQGAVNDRHAVSQLNSVRFIRNRERCC